MLVQSLTVFGPEPEFSQPVLVLAADCLWRPVPPPPRQSAFRRLAVKIRCRLDQFRSVYFIERVGVEHGIPNSFDLACYDWNRATRQTNMKMRGLRSEPILRHSRFLSDPQMEPSAWIRGPGRPVLRA